MVVTPKPNRTFNNPQGEGARHVGNVMNVPTDGSGLTRTHTPGYTLGSHKNRFIYKRILHMLAQVAVVVFAVPISTSYLYKSACRSIVLRFAQRFLKWYVVS